MHPVLLDLPPLGVRILSSPTFVVAGYVCAFLLAVHLGSTLAGIEARSSCGVCLLLAAIALLGGRLAFVASHPPQALAGWLGVFAVWRGGRHAPGSILALVLTAPVLLRAAGIPFLRFADCGVIAVLVGLAIARVGCFLHGCCVGTECAWPWCVRYPPTAPIYNMHLPQGLIAHGAARSLSVHPLPLYFGAVALAVAGSARGAWARRRYDGQILLLALLAFGASSAGLEFLRHDYRGRAYWGALPQLFWLSAAIAVGAAIALAAAEIRYRRTRP